MESLPKFVCFLSYKNDKYLRYKNDMTQTRSLVQFEGDDVTDAFAHFKIVESNIDGGGLVHIKCRYNNLYLVRWSRSHYWIGASAYEQQEDKTSWACTLFKPFFFEHCRYQKSFRPCGTDVRLLHVQSGRYVRLPSSNVSAPYVSCLLADSKEPDNENSSDLLTAINLVFPFKLPKRVAFRGDNSLYLGAELFDGQPGLQFSFDDPKDPMVAHEIIPFPDGTISIKSEYYGCFWRVERDIQNNFIVVDADAPKNSETGTFRVNQIHHNVVAILSMNPTLYLKRMNGTDIVWMDSIGANTQDVEWTARIRIVDLDM